jgi:putative FmdB family regulatory protein
MPVYQYACRHCESEFEYLVLRTSPPAECPVCHSKDLEQMISLYAVSSDSIRDANLMAQHKRMAARRHDRTRQEHEALHSHFEDDIKN